MSEYISADPIQSFTMYNPPDVRWDVLIGTMSQYYLRLHRILGLNGVPIQRNSFGNSNVPICCWLEIWLSSYMYYPELHTSTACCIPTVGFFFLLIPCMFFSSLSVLLATSFRRFFMFSAREYPGSNFVNMIATRVFCPKSWTIQTRVCRQIRISKTADDSDYRPPAKFHRGSPGHVRTAWQLNRLCCSSQSIQEVSDNVLPNLLIYFNGLRPHLISAGDKCHLCVVILD